MASHPPHPVSDIDFRKIVAILRLAVPYTGIIMSTRESAHIRRETFALGVSQISAGSRTNPGGYAEDEREDASQFCLGDHRPLDEVDPRRRARSGTSRRSARPATGSAARGGTSWTWPSPATIKEHCDPNALATFVEYLLDYGSAETRAVGDGRVDQILEPRWNRDRGSWRRAWSSRCGRDKRDVYC